MNCIVATKQLGRQTETANRDAFYQFFVIDIFQKSDILSGCVPKILITQIGQEIDFLQILYVNCTLSGYFKNTFRLGSKCFLRQFTRGVSWWTKMDILLAKKMPILVREKVWILQGRAAVKRVLSN